jgi:hypothetical protein
LKSDALFIDENRIARYSDWKSFRPVPSSGETGKEEVTIRDV